MALGVRLGPGHRDKIRSEGDQAGIGSPAQKVILASIQDVKIEPVKTNPTAPIILGKPPMCRVF
jgi:hypothetical protein